MSGGFAPPPPPRLPAPVRRVQRDGAAPGSFSVDIETVTPILGGAPETRAIDRVDVIRAPTIRGHLRLWWRALQRDPELFADAARFAAAEAALWGRAADAAGGRSQVAVSVEMLQPARIDEGNVNVSSVEGYALWPARRNEQDPAPAPRRQPGLRFRLHVTAPAPDLPAVRNAVRAWILFGGYGGRTRRGVGSLTVAEEEQTEWLPHLDRPDSPAGRGQLRQRLKAVFGADVFAPAPLAMPSFPVLAGAALVIGAFDRSGMKAWKEALEWLRDFRQRALARDRGTEPRPGRSRWPEPDKLRRLFNTCAAAHQPRYDALPVWPRAQFGLPILGRFSNAGPGEPPPFELTWQNDKGDVQERMASPLVVKALPVVGGFFPCALWLTRDYPPGRVVVVRQENRARGAVAGSAADFRAALSAADRAVARELAAPWDGSSQMRESFLSAVLGNGPGRQRPFRVAP